MSHLISPTGNKKWDEIWLVFFRQLPEDVLKALAPPWCIFYLWNSEYISHMYAGKQRTKTSLTSFIFIWYKEGKRVNILATMSGLKKFADTGIQTHHLPIRLVYFSPQQSNPEFFASSSRPTTKLRQHSLVLRPEFSTFFCDHVEIFWKVFLSQKNNFKFMLISGKFHFRKLLKNSRQERKNGYRKNWGLPFFSFLML